MPFPFERIVCLTEETVETLYLLEEDRRIVGVTGYAVRPARVRKEKPRVGAFTSADIPKIVTLKPDLVLTFSDLQADIAAELVRQGLNVHAFNQRTVGGILDMIETIGALTGAGERAKALASSLRLRLAAPARSECAPRVYFEEWDDPIITGIGWVSELIEAAGGIDCFSHLRKHQSASDRIIQPSEVIDARPDIIIGSWCGKKFRPEKVAKRDGWHEIPAVANNRIYEIKSPIILQPGPAALTDGFDAIRAMVSDFTAAQEVHSHQT